jgi:hypothetical protein
MSEAPEIPTRTHDLLHEDLVYLTQLRREYEEARESQDLYDQWYAAQQLAVFLWRHVGQYGARLSDD